MRRRVSREEECWCVVGHDDDARILKAVFGFEAYFLHYNCVWYIRTTTREKKKRNVAMRSSDTLFFSFSFFL